jgi:hypothetical protein
VIEALDAGEAAVGERFVDEPPKIFGRLEYETNAVGHGEVLGPGTTYVLQNQEATQAQTSVVARDHFEHAAGVAPRGRSAA